MAMLYERWRQVSDEFRNEIALYDLASNERWTFAQLAAIAESSEAPDGPVAFVEASGADFIFSVLSAWRFGKIVFPLESGKLRPTFTGIPQDCAHLKFASASGGSTRMVKFQAGQLMADAANIVGTMQLQQNAPNIGVISLAHSYGFSNLVLPLLLHGIPLGIVGSTQATALRSAAQQFEKITLPAVPSLWRTWLNVNAIPKNIQIAVSATASLPLDLEQEVFSKHGIKIRNFYSASECGGIAFDRNEKPRTDHRFIGEPLDHVQLHENENGCLEVSGPAVGETYWPEADEMLARGRFITSDLGVIRDGNVYLLGGVNDQITVAGQKIPSELIEAALRTHPDVADSIVFGVPGEAKSCSEIIVACVVVRGRITGEILKQFLRNKLPSWQLPREWWFVDSLQTNGRGKPSRADCRENYLKNKSAADIHLWAR